MLAIENYNVQEIRKLARAEADHLRAEADRQRAEADRRADKSELLLKSAVKLLLSQGSTISQVAEQMGIPEQELTNVLPELV
jgi:regulator of protease activity HflC (stomatin/prohibitin superfamily)